MILLDVNVLVYAFRKDVPLHAAYKAWIEEVLNSDHAFGMSELVLSAFVRITTSNAYRDPFTITQALAIAERVRTSPVCVVVSPGERHWEIFTELCRKCGIRGADVTDAYLAALAIEHGCEWITADKGFSRFPGLKWRHPLDVK